MPGYISGENESLRLLLVKGCCVVGIYSGDTILFSVSLKSRLLKKIFFND